VDESDKRRVLNAKLDWDVAVEAANRKREAFHKIVHGLYYGPKRRGDAKELAELLEVTPTQVKRYADGETSGNRGRKGAADGGGTTGSGTSQL